MINHLEQLARTPRLLIATDFDGTMGPIVPHPDDASASPGVVDLLKRAMALPQTFVAVVSGRALADLRRRLGPLPGAWLVGGHGSEISGPDIEDSPDDVSLLLESIAEPLRRIAPPAAGFLHERKPMSIAVHYRQVDPAVATEAIQAITRTVAEPAGLRLRPGKMVLELLAVDADKGRGLQKVREVTGATGVIYFGDDTTDEDAFRVLGEGDLSIKIGKPPTDAEFSVGTIGEAHTLLAELIEQRRAAV